MCILNRILLGTSLRTVGTSNGICHFIDEFCVKIISRQLNSRILMGFGFPGGLGGRSFLSKYGKLAGMKS